VSQNVVAVMGEKEHTKKWTAALMRVQGKTLRAAAEAAKVVPKTVTRWEADDPQYAAYFDRHLDKLRRTSWGLVWSVLQEHVASRDPHVSLRACHIMLQSMDRERPQNVTMTQEDRVVIVVEEEAALPLEDPYG
jgi:hypothetical protein